MVHTGLGKKVKPYFENNQSPTNKKKKKERKEKTNITRAKGWRVGSSGREPA
jgi:hypothetical protein